MEDPSDQDTVRMTLTGAPCIWLGSGFLPASAVAFASPPEWHPYLSQVPPAFLPYRQLLCLLGVSLPLPTPLPPFANILSLPILLPQCLLLPSPQAHPFRQPCTITLFGMQCMAGTDPQSRDLFVVSTHPRRSGPSPPCTSRKSLTQSR